MAHTVEKIGGTSMTRFGEILQNVIIGHRQPSELYNRIFIVSAYGGITNLLLENKKNGAPASMVNSHETTTAGRTPSKTSVRKCSASTEPLRI